MPFYILMRKPIKAGVFADDNTDNPTEKTILSEVKSYERIYLLHSLDDAKSAAAMFFSVPTPPKTSGSYGLIAEVTVEYKELPATEPINASDIYNNWVNTQKVQYSKRESSETTYQGSIILSTQIKSVVCTYIPDSAKPYNKNLQDTNFIEKKSSSCSIM